MRYFHALAVTDDLIVELSRAPYQPDFFHLDGQPSSVSGGVAETFECTCQSSAIKPFPSKMVFYPRRGA